MTAPRTTHHDVSPHCPETPPVLLKRDTTKRRLIAQEKLTTMTKKVAFLSASLFSLSLSVPSPAKASEPLDNTPPWGTNDSLPVANLDVTAYITNQAGSGWGTAPPNRQITPSGDVDYAVIGCGKQNAGSLGTIKDVRVAFTHALGDIDIKLFGFDGTLLGTSQSVTDFEKVDISALARTGAVLKVYGFNGATNNYSVTVVCQ